MNGGLKAASVVVGFLSVGAVSPGCAGDGQGDTSASTYDDGKADGKGDANCRSELCGLYVAQLDAQGRWSTPAGSAPLLPGASFRFEVDPRAFENPAIATKENAQCVNQTERLGAEEICSMWMAARWFDDAGQPVKYGGGSGGVDPTWASVGAFDSRRGLCVFEDLVAPNATYWDASKMAFWLELPEQRRPGAAETPSCGTSIQFEVTVALSNPPAELRSACAGDLGKNPYACANPDGKPNPDPGPSSSGTSQGDTSGPMGNCGVDEFSCGDQQCIPSSYVCDGDDDCGNQSDEEDCADTGEGPGEGYDCDIGEYSCDSGECIPEDYLCDGEADCDDGYSDEDPGICGDDTSAPGACEDFEGYECWSGKCIGDNDVCDGYLDCPDGDDEDGC